MSGTPSFAQEKEYHEYMQQNGGFANAYTACYFTNYMFEVALAKVSVHTGHMNQFAGFPQSRLSLTWAQSQ
eukprot:1036923-Amphidinium_carterae.1